MNHIQPSHMHAVSFEQWLEDNERNLLALYDYMEQMKSSGFYVFDKTDFTEFCYLAYTKSTLYGKMNDFTTPDSDMH